MTIIPYTGSVSGTVIIGIPVTTSTTTTTTTSSSPTPTATCSFDQEVRTDANGIDYQIACGRDTNGGAQGTPYGTTNSANSFEECYVICDGITNCQGFVWLGATGSFGNGPGTCYFKGTGTPGQGISFVGEFESSKVGAIKVDQDIPPPPAYFDTTTTTYVHALGTIALRNIKS